MFPSPLRGEQVEAVVGLDEGPPPLEYNGLDGVLLLLQHLDPGHPSHRPSLGPAIRSVQLAGVEETLYATLPEDFLDCLLRQCPALHSLGLAGMSALVDGAVRRVRLQAPHPHLLRLDVAHTTNLGEEGLIRLVGMFPCLEILIAKGCRSGMTDRALAALVTGSGALRRLEMAETTLTDAGVERALTKGAGGLRHLEHLELSGCSRLGEGAFARLAHALPCLSTLIVSGCPRFTEQALLPFLQLRPLRRLEVQQCRALYRLPGPLLQHWFTCYGSSLQHLALSMPSLEALPASQLTGTFLLLTALEELELDGIDTERHSTEFVLAFGVRASRLVRMGGTSGTSQRTHALARIRLVRRSNEADFISNDYYTTVPGHKVGGWDESFLGEFRRATEGRVAISLELEAVS